MELLKPGIVQILKVKPPSLTDEETRQINAAINRPWTEEDVIKGRFVISVSMFENGEIERIETCLRNAGWDVVFMPSYAMDGAQSIGVRPRMN